jgi:hypothetical protein
MTDRYSSFEIPQDDKRQIVDHRDQKTVFRASRGAASRLCSQPTIDALSKSNRSAGLENVRNLARNLPDL